MTNRQAFLSGLFIEDLDDLMAWNKDRDSNEKAKFITFLSILYAHHTKKVDLLTRMDDEDGLVPVDELQSCHSKSEKGSRSASQSLSRWMQKSVKSGESTVMNSSTTGSSFTHFSELTATTDNSLPFIPLARYTTDYRSHDRAMAVNRRTWNPRQNQERSTFDSHIFPLCTSDRAL